MVASLDVFSIVLIPLTILSYLPQWDKLLTSRTTTEISLPATLLLALSAQAQIVTMYYLFLCPPSKQYGSIISNPPTLRDWVNLAQVLVQWGCSLVQFILVLTFASRSDSTNNRHPDSATPSPTATKSSARISLALILLHAGFSIAWAYIMPIPTTDWLDLAFVFTLVLNNICINPLITAATATSFILQIRKTKKPSPGNPTSLNSTSLTLQALTFLALAVSWPARFTMPRDLWYEDGLWVVKEWYPHVGWVAVNNGIVAVGEYLVLHAVEGAGGGGSRESQALLG
ncbi:hypothetical protein M409DRAFT_53544 [Zasmidium cellare ATCC 36951]|uniref:Uncharacterized protein n=1 Tax=Zasmidium cellare ATCC 36951 TaxID=1080233 RepID=A0A6A6CRY9_ZASCE|nr:uncharacterized protein M409DRAFT_53544 [Zasmidium cellare ATCC 36951]KAF2168256.1 hypothetical protein M409DRAFT_53544 [Zasmidium cellare ATCC 36951]